MSCWNFASDLGLRVGQLGLPGEDAESVRNHLAAHAVGDEPEALRSDLAKDELEGLGELAAGCLRHRARPPIAAQGRALIAGPVEEQDRRVDVQHVPEKCGLAQRRGEGFAKAVHHHQQRAVGRLLDQVTHALDEGGPVEGGGLVDLDHLVLEPGRGIDEHADAQARLDVGVERAELERSLALRSEALFEGVHGVVRDAIGHVVEAIGAARAELGDGHAAEAEGLGALEDRVRAGEVERVEPGAQEHQRDREEGQGDLQSAASHRCRSPDSDRRV
jgi:hypothetical protein